MRTIPTWLIVVFSIIALIGFLDASYLTAEYFQGTVPPCTIVNGCQTVLTSSYSAIGGVPVSGIGMAYYGTLLMLLLIAVESKNTRILRGAAWLTIAGLVASLYFMFVQTFILSAYCLYCIGSAVTSTLLFLIGLRIIYLNTHAH